MTIFFEHKTGRWISDNYGEAYDKACKVMESVWWGDRTPGGRMINLQRVLRPQAPDMTLKGGKVRITEKPDI